MREAHLDDRGGQAHIILPAACPLLAFLWRLNMTAAALLKKAIAAQESREEYVGFCRICGA